MIIEKCHKLKSCSVCFGLAFKLVMQYQNDHYINDFGFSKYYNSCDCKGDLHAFRPTQYEVTHSFNQLAKYIMLTT